MDVTPSFSAAEFGRIIARENDEVELKSGIGRDPLQAALVAMSNTSGGTVYIGVNDQRRVIGRTRDQGTDDAIHEAALAARGLGHYSITEAMVAEKSIVMIRIDRRDDEVAQTSDGRVLVRRGGRNVPLFGHELWSLMASKALHRFETSDSGLAGTAVEPELASMVAERYGWADQSEWPNRWAERRLMHPTGRLTYAGALALTDPSKSLGAARFGIDLRSYEDDSSRSYVRREQIGGPIQVQVQAATDWVLRDIGTEMIITGAVRHDVARLPPRSVRETIANAIAHRDYTIDRMPVVIEVRPSHVIVRSPGSLPAPVTIATLREAQSARNPTIIDILRRFGLAEDSGQGIDVIEDQLRSEFLDDPTFSELGAAFEVRLPLRGLVSTTERGWLAEFERQGVLRSEDRPVVLAVVRHGRITNAKAREVMGVDSVRARTALQRLARGNLLHQHGERGRAYYTLGVIGPERGIEDAVLDAAAAEDLTNARVREITGLDREGALVVLRRLVHRGLLEQTGSKRGTRYRPAPSVVAIRD